MNKPKNMTEKCDVLNVIVGTQVLKFEPKNKKATWFVDDHGNKWVRFKVVNGNTIVLPQERVGWVVQ